MTGTATINSQKVFDSELVEWLTHDSSDARELARATTSLRRTRYELSKLLDSYLNSELACCHPAAGRQNAGVKC